MNRDIRNITAGADLGHYSLPQEWTATRAALKALSVHLVALTTRGATDTLKASIDGEMQARGAEARAVAELVQRAMAGAELPKDTASGVIDAKLAAEKAAIEGRVARAAFAKTETRLESLVRSDADLFVSQHLQPALDEVLETTRKAAPLLADVDLENPASIVAGSKAVHAAYMAVRDAATRYEALRVAQAALWRIAGRPFGELTESRTGSRTKLSDDPVTAMLRLAARDVWIPTTADETAAQQAQRAAEGGAVAGPGRRIPVGL